MNQQHDSLDRLWSGDMSPAVKQVSDGLLRGLAKSETAKPIAQRNERYVHQMDNQEEDDATV